MTGTPPDLLERAAAAEASVAVAKRVVPLLDLTALGEHDTEGDIRALSARAYEHGVAAVCIWPSFLGVARAALAGSPVKLATVTNFPEGGDDLARAVAETEAAVAAGADEIDVVAPIAATLEGDIGLVGELVEACKAACGERTLKVILETGRLQDPAVITAAARSAIMAGADFLKTSTGKVPVGATLEHAAVLLAVLEEAGGRVGIKFSGGIRTTQQAAGYLALVEHFMGADWIGPARVRFGASSLLDDLIGTT